MKLRIVEVTEFNYDGSSTVKYEVERKRWFLFVPYWENIAYYHWSGLYQYTLQGAVEVRDDVLKNGLRKTKERVVE